MAKKTNNKRFSFLQFPKFKFIFNKNKESKGSSVILIKGSLLTCIILSIASGFIDLAFFSGLSKSLLHVGTLPLYAAVLYTLISIGFISAKFWCAMKIGMIRELRTRLEARAITWSSRLNKAIIPWHIAHKFLIAVSILTALSLSVNSIGAGIRTMEQNINNMQKDAALLIELDKSVRTGENDRRVATKENFEGQRSAQRMAESETSRYYDLLVKYQDQYKNLDDDDTLTDEEKRVQRESIITKIVKEIPGTNRQNALYFNRADLRRSIQAKAMQNEVLDTSSYEDDIAYDKALIDNTIKALMDKEYRFPDGELIMFTNENGELIDIQLAISRLQNGIARWQNDTGDVGESSKIFSMIAVYINADTKAGGMGVSEWMMMIFIAIAGIVQEFLIALFTPKAAIDRKLLSQVSHYLLWENKEQKERFLISVYTDYVGDGIINEEDFNFKCSKCVSLMEQSEDDIIQKFSKKKDKAPKAAVVPTVQEVVSVPAAPQEVQYSSKVDDAIKEIEDLL